MTLREHAVGGTVDGTSAVVPDLLVVVATAEDAAALAPLGRPTHVGGEEETDGPAQPVLVATGPDPLAVDEALDDLGAPAGRLLLLDGPCDTWAEEAARMVVRLDALLAEEPPGGVVVRGGTEAALAAARSAVRLRVPLVHLTAEQESSERAATQAAVAELAAWQTSPSGGVPYPTEIDLLVHRRLAPPQPSRHRAADPTVVRMPSGRGPRSSMTA
ncbi:UDP-N-acetylglucosamine 2-epimerase [Actinomycetospora sp. TBRC 11914]|uniref:UDP-N-acetylglucosamine 2-epimerase n=1 Tax=Actinomycetospora sp. TBRC 11914 TaxID=2729387 RepID=UPI00145DC286|nr:UDP-N-acetylglucosamine 2-epimerase [Actinomycetospora sp. TBRC 11914]NMO92041.1 hypothetical protein [Actinomycetospora sp. TBRC 11914]